MAGAAKQSQAEKYLQRGDLPRDRTLRQRQLLRRTGVTFVAGGGVKAGQGLKGRIFLRMVCVIYTIWALNASCIMHIYLIAV